MLLQYALQPIEILSLRQVRWDNASSVHLVLYFIVHSVLCCDADVLCCLQMLEFGRAALYNNSFVLDSACRVQREVSNLHFASCIT